MFSSRILTSIPSLGRGGGELGSKELNCKMLKNSYNISPPAKMLSFHIKNLVFSSLIFCHARKVFSYPVEFR